MINENFEHTKRNKVLMEENKSLNKKLEILNSGFDKLQGECFCSRRVLGKGHK